jgi:two-component sensor histidine kinase
MIGHPAMNVVMPRGEGDISGVQDDEWSDRQRYAGNADSDLRPLQYDLPSDVIRNRADHNRSGINHLAPISQYEEVASAAAGISRQRARLLGILLAAAPPASCGGHPVLRPIWATEALHRAHSTVRLVGRLEQRMPSRDDQSRLLDFETNIGVELASIFDSLAITNDEELRPCSSNLRDLARNLIALFGPTIGHVTVATSVDRLALPAFRHRALILIASELVTNILLHAFRHRHAGQVALQLTLLGRGVARLAVTDDGDRLFDRALCHPARCSVINYLADLLEAELVYRPRPGGGTIAEIEFPTLWQY